MQMHYRTKRNITPPGPKSPAARSALFTLYASNLGSQILTCSDFIYLPWAIHITKTRKAQSLYDQHFHCRRSRCETKLQQKRAWWMRHQSKGDSVNESLMASAWEEPAAHCSHRAVLTNPFLSIPAGYWGQKYSESSVRVFFLQNKDGTTTISLVLRPTSPASRATLSSDASISLKATLKSFWLGSPLVSLFLVACLSCSHPAPVTPIEIA